MARYLITTTVDAARKESVEKILRVAFKNKEGEEPIICSVEKQTSPESRSARLQEAEGIVADAISIVEELQDEMQTWYDSIPENLQQGEKAEEVQAAVDALDELKSELENIGWTNVEFPGMF